MTIRSKISQKSNETKLRGGTIARKTRVWYPGAVYHVIARGNNHQRIFTCNEDYKIFLIILEQVKDKYPFNLHAFCLMTNHFHVLIGTYEIEIGIIMKQLIQRYTIFYNHKYNKSSHLFQGRYGSGLVDTDAYFLHTSRYIHLNPVKAQMVEKPEKYRWSSYRTYIGMANIHLITMEQTYGYFKDNPKEDYKKFVEDMSVFEIEDEIRKVVGEDELWLPW